MFSIPVAAAWGGGGFAATAGTVVRVVVPPKANYFTRLTKLRYVSAGTLHTLTVRRAFARTTLSAAAAAAQAVIALTRNPGLYAANNLADGKGVPKTADNAIAANDFLVIATPDLTYHLGMMSSGTFDALTLSANVPTGGFAAGAKVWFFGALTNIDPNTGLADPVFSPTVSVPTEYSDNVGGVVGTLNRDEPLIIESSNATAAGIIEQISAVYTTK